MSEKVAAPVKANKRGYRGAGTLVGPGMKDINDAARERNHKDEDDRKINAIRRARQKEYWGAA